MKETLLVIALLAAVARAAEPQHVVVASEQGSFLAWPANGGLWTWDDGREAVVAFVSGPYTEQKGHNIGKQQTNLSARTLDGGLTWHMEHPQNFAQAKSKYGELKSPINFANPNFAMRCIATGYDIAGDSRGGFQFSMDRGKSWQGPFRFGGLDGSAALKKWEVTCRTDYVVNGPAEAFLMMSARTPGKGATDRTFWASTKDGGLHFEFGGWVVGMADPSRAVMPSTVRLSASQLVTAIRRRGSIKNPCWVDAYGSSDNGATWTFLSRVGETGGGNGNPPALTRLRDGRLCCAYGDRSRKQMRASISSDSGATWGAPIVVRYHFRADKYGDADFCYPRQFQRADGRIVTIYYWSQANAPESCIAGTIWDPPAK
ncbi:MAG: exo-alpha-sialidase [Verrucomicrobia bacterium]|nr:exo-alpha-sialidase [Verrucomicrobiota bacterium]